MTITPADILSEVKEKNVTFLRLMFTDILGTLKNVEVPATEEQLEKILDNKMMFDGSSIEGFVRINESDMYLYPDLDTWIIFPWGDENGKVAGLICDVYNPDGTAFAGDPRGNLKRALTHMEATGFKSFNLTKKAIQHLKSMTKVVTLTLHQRIQRIIPAVKSSMS